MMSWGTKRRNTILLLLFIFIGAPIGFISFKVFYNPPSCFDAKQNGTEEGVDCGGSCQLICTNQVIKPVALWERFFKVSDKTYNLLAYIENPNTSAYVHDAHYVFKVYNEKNILITERRGVTAIAPKSVRPVIENNVTTFEQIPSRVTFEFEGDLTYIQTEPQDSIIIIKDEVMENENTSPRVKAKIQNISLKKIENIDVAILVYDVFDNVLNTSSTFVDRLDSEESRDIVFTWPQKFTDKVARIEVIPIYDFK